MGKVAGIGNAKKYNSYDLTSKSYAVCHTNNGATFIFDKEDYPKVKDACWYKDSSTGYIRGRLSGSNQIIYFHRFVANASRRDIVDHRDHNILDNRKQNLRKCTKAQNCANASKRTDNSSGCSGVWFDNERKKWATEITVNRKKIFLGRYDSYDKAVEVRKNAEKEYFKEYSYDNSVSKANEVM